MTRRQRLRALLAWARIIVTIVLAGTLGTMAGRALTPEPQAVVVVVCQPQPPDVDCYRHGGTVKLHR